MSIKELRKVMLTLNTVCIKHAKFNHYYAPIINTNAKITKDINAEITKMMHYLEFPYYSHLNKQKIHK